jgi:putative DNA primase/helicase
MLACIQDAAGPCGDACTGPTCRTGRKLKAADAKKVLSAGINGAAVRLFEADEELAVCRRHRDGLALHLATRQAGVGRHQRRQPGKAVAAADGAQGLHVYADNDADGDFAGQCYAYTLARRLKREQKSGAERQVQGVRAAPCRHRLGRRVAPALARRRRHASSEVPM